MGSQKYRTVFKQIDEWGCSRAHPCDESFFLLTPSKCERGGKGSNEALWSSQNMNLHDDGILGWAPPAAEITAAVALH
jgi:hypothetical protein